MKRTVLLAEDNKNDTLLLEKSLSKAGFSVVMADNGEEAFLKFSENPADVVMADLVMPKIDGISLLKLIKKTKPDTPVILFSRNGNIEKAVKAIKYGAFDFLEKPINYQKLEDVVNRCLAGPGGNGNGAGQGEDAKADEITGSSLEARLDEHRLTPQEKNITKTLLTGATEQEIADSFHISLHTVRKHIHNIYKKIGIRRRVDLFVRFR